MEKITNDTLYKQYTKEEYRKCFQMMLELSYRLEGSDVELRFEGNEIVVMEEVLEETEKQFRTHDINKVLNFIEKDCVSPFKKQTVKKSYSFQGKARKYKNEIAVDADGVALSTDFFPHKDFELIEGKEYKIEVYEMK